METFLIVIHVIVSILLMVVILLQSSKGGGLAGVFGGGGGMGTVFGGRGAASFLQKATTVLAGIFLALALLVSYMDKGKPVDQNVVAEEMEKLRASSPAAILPTVNEATPGNATLPVETPTTQDTGK
ncbi:preprotein translocase subunit SecG [candidate division KSB1 bacterium 4484_87]|nr:MAG: preprotein translocase subunit SecG [candidate division KSB1 bacterium 4484_87]